MATQIVENDHVARLERRREHTLHVDAEDGAVHGTVDHERRRDAVMTKRRDEGRGLPVSMGHPADQAHAPAASAVAARHVGLGPGLVDENKMAWIKRRLMTPPSSARRRHVGAILLAGEHGFF